MTPRLPTLLLAASLSLSAAAEPAEPDIFKGADLALGQRLMAEHRCAECHARQVGGDGDDIYNPQGRLRSAGQLRGMVEACNTQLKLQLFPEEVTAISAALNRRHYRFTQ